MARRDRPRHLAGRGLMEYRELPAGEAAIGDAARHVASGGLLVHPTSGVYGIGGRHDAAVEAALAGLKNRPSDARLIYLVDGGAGARKAFPEVRWGALADRLARAFWPGPLTLVLEDGSPAGRAVRSEAHAVTGAVVSTLGAALSSTSLNRSGEPAARTPAEARSVLDALPASARPVLWIDAGELPGPPPSSLVRLRGDRYEVLREGAIGRDAIEAAAGPVRRRTPETFE